MATKRKLTEAQLQAALEARALIGPVMAVLQEIRPSSEFDADDFDVLENDLRRAARQLSWIYSELTMADEDEA